MNGVLPTKYGFKPHLENREAFLRLNRLLAPTAPPLVTGTQPLCRDESPQSRVYRSHSPREVHGQVHERVERVAAVTALSALELKKNNKQV